MFVLVRAGLGCQTGAGSQPSGMPSPSIVLGSACGAHLLHLLLLDAPVLFHDLQLHGTGKRRRRDKQQGGNDLYVSRAVIAHSS